MTRTNIYMAVNEFNHAFICKAYTKKQMKAACLNMRLDWQKKESIEAAKKEIKFNSLCLLHITDVTSFKY